MGAADRPASGAAPPRLRVAGVPRPGCWARLPTQLAEATHQALEADARGGGLAAQGLRLPLPLELVADGPAPAPGAPPARWLVAWDGGASASADLELPAALLRALAVPEGAVVRCRPLPGLPAARRVTVAPRREGDYEALGVQASALEDGLLQQVGVMQEGTAVPLWVGGAPVAVDVLAVAPGPCARVAPGTEIEVLPDPPPAAAPAGGEGGDGAGGPPAVGPPLRRPLRAFDRARLEGLPAADLAFPVTDVFAPAHEGLAGLALTVQDWWTGWAHPDTLFDLGLARGARVAVSGRRLRGAAEPRAGPFAGKGATRFVNRYPLELRASRAVPPGHLGLPEAALRLLNVAHLDSLAVAVLGREPAPVAQVRGLAVQVERPAGTELGRDVKRFGKELADFATDAFRLVARRAAEGHAAGRVLVGPTALVTVAAPALGPAARFHLRFECGDGKWGDPDAFGALGPEFKLAKAKASGVFKGLATPLERHPPPWAGPAAAPGWADGAFRAVLAGLRPALGAAAGAAAGAVPGGTIVHGRPACGKTSLLKQVAAHLEAEAHAKVVFLECKALAHLDDAGVVRQLAEAVALCRECQPALLVLNDLDALLPAAPEAGGGEAEVDAALRELRTSGVVDLLDAARRPGRRPHRIALCCSARSAGALAKELKKTGRFDRSVEVPLPTLAGRAEALAGVARDLALDLPAPVAAHAAARMKGCDLRDLQTVAHRALHAAAWAGLARGPAPPGGPGGDGPGPPAAAAEAALRVEDVEAALEGFVPGHAQGVSAPVAGPGGEGRGWDSIGGLAEVVAALREMFELPARYAGLFAAAPLRLRSGALLFGPAGCGKTYAVGVAAEACGLRCVSVKGPELLSKYIGSSEAAVRDVFQKARDAAPALLFFDEFDALAPQRGHDNTGVTDRVVNQLLTELDGAQGLEGVFVLAATSRPDLIEPALLRPGRLDHLLFCGFPGAAAREAILEVAGRRVPLADGVRLGELARATDGYTGADLRALLTAAQLLAVKDTLGGGDGAGGGAEGGAVGAGHLARALREGGATFSPSERRGLEALYAGFREGGGGGKRAAAAAGKRVTLA